MITQAADDPAFWASLRHRMENTSEPTADINRDSGLHRTTFYRRAKADGWRLRRTRRVRGEGAWTAPSDPSARPDAGPPMTVSRRKRIDPRRLKWLKYLYERTELPSVAIAELGRMDRVTLRDLTAREGWVRFEGSRGGPGRWGPTPPPPPPSTAVVVDLAGAAGENGGRTLVERLRAAAEREAARLEAGGGGHAIAGLVRAVSELRRLEAAASPEDKDDDDGIDLDELRREFTERLRQSREDWERERRGA